MDSIKTSPIMENEHVKELLELMEANNSLGRKDLLAVISQVAAMESHLATMVMELAVMRKELAEARQVNSPTKATMQKVVIAMQSQILELRDKLAELKQDVINGCKSAIAKCKEKGLSALRNITEYFDIKPRLESMRDILDNSIKQDNKMISRIEAMSVEYHEAERHLKNIGRAFAGKEAIQETKPVGKLAKAIEAPIKTDRACLLAMRNCINNTIGGLNRLENAERKPPIMETINKLNKQIAQSQRDAPIVERQKPCRTER